MADEGRTAANTANAQLSTGPRSTEGKARVALNALKHGLSGKQVVLPGENPEEFDQFRAAFFNDRAPQRPLEEFLVDRIVMDAWRLRRIYHLEAALYQCEERAAKIRSAHEGVAKYEKNLSMVQEFSIVDPKNYEAHQRATENFEKMVASEPFPPLSQLIDLTEKCAAASANLERHETARFRSLIKALHELERLQARRAGQPVLAPAAVDIDFNIGGNRDD
jgi:hypothetical protein